MPTAVRSGQDDRPEQVPQPPKDGQPGPSQPGQPFVTAPRPQAGPVTPTNEDEAFLFGPTVRPGEHPAAGSAAGGVGATPSKDVYAAAPAIMEAAAEPGAPAALKALAMHLSQLMAGE